MTRANPLSIFTAVLVTAPLFACAPLRPNPDYTALGPGARFPTLEAAVVDALAYAHAEGRRNRTSDRLRGGVITSSQDGFTYREIRTADGQQPSHIEYSLGRHDVARFHAYPISMSPAQNRLNDRPSPADRASVDHVDPLHRPVFVLTPRLVVKAYYGDNASVETVADLRDYRGEQLVADGGR